MSGSIGHDNAVYTFAVRAKNGSGASGRSNSVTLAFPSTCTGPPQAPVDFLAYRTGSTIQAIWQPAAAGPAPTSYQLSVTGAFTASIPTAERGVSGTVGPGTYNLRVVALNMCGSSPATPVQTVSVP